MRWGGWFHEMGGLVSWDGEGLVSWDGEGLVSWDGEGLVSWDGGGAGFMRGEGLVSWVPFHLCIVVIRLVMR